MIKHWVEKWCDFCDDERKMAWIITGLLVVGIIIAIIRW